MVRSLLCCAAIFIPLSRALQLTNSSDGSGDREELRCAAEGSRMQRTGKRIAVLMKGETFRTLRGEFSQAEMQSHLQHGVAYRSTCGNHSYEAQSKAASSLLGHLKYFESQGYEVDMFGSTFPCTNGLSYQADLKQMYSPYLKHLRVLDSEAFKHSTQITLFKDVVDLAFRHVRKTSTFYKLVYVFRWDHDVRCEQFRLGDEHPFPRDTWGLTSGLSRDENFLVPGKFLPCFHEFLWKTSEDAPDDQRCCRAQKPCGSGGGTCFQCIENFMKTFYSDIKWQGDMGNYHTCSNPTRTSSMPAPEPDWLPEHDQDCP